MLFLAMCSIRRLGAVNHMNTRPRAWHMICEICGAEGRPLLKVMHKKLGPRRICEECYMREIEMLLEMKRCC